MISSISYTNYKLISVSYLFSLGDIFLLLFRLYNSIQTYQISTLSKTLDNILYKALMISSFGNKIKSLVNHLSSKSIILPKLGYIIGSMQLKTLSHRYLSCYNAFIKRQRLLHIVLYFYTGHSRATQSLDTISAISLTKEASLNRLGCIDTNPL